MGVYILVNQPFSVLLSVVSLWSSGKHCFNHTVFGVLRVSRKLKLDPSSYDGKVHNFFCGIKRM